MSFYREYDMGCICSNIQFIHKALDYVYIGLPRGSLPHTESISRSPSIRTYTGSVGIKGILDVHFQSGAFVKTELILFFTTIFCEDSVPTNNMVSLKLGPKRAWRLLLLPKRLGGFYIVAKTTCGNYCCKNGLAVPAVAKSAW